MKEITIDIEEFKELLRAKMTLELIEYALDSTRYSSDFETLVRTMLKKKESENE